MIRLAFAAAAAAVVLAPRAVGAQEGMEEAARFLLDAPIYSTGDFHASVERTAAWAAEHADHPLAEAALVLLESLGEDPDDAAFLAESVLALDPSLPWSAAARRHLAILRARARMLAAGAGVPEQDLHADYVRSFLVLGSWDGVPNPRPEWRANEVGYLRPEWIGPEHGERGDARWTPLERAPWRRDVMPASVLRESASGQVWTAVVLDVERGGPAWIEVELVGASDLVGREYSGAVPGYALRVNEGPARVSTQLDGERSEIERHPVVLRTGRNVVQLQSSLGRGWTPRFALRVLAPDGSLLPGVSSAAASDPWEQPLGAAVDAQPPSVPLVGAIEHLLALAERGPACEALLGVLLARDGRRPTGIAHLRAAHERAVDDPCLATHLVLHTLAATHLPDAWRQARAREIAERVLAAVPDHHAMGLLLASIRASEDAEEQAIELLETLTEAHRRSPQPPFALASVLEKLGLDVRAEAALDEALVRAPSKVRTLLALAEHLASVGRRRESAETREKAARASGSVPELLADAAADLAAVGELERALALSAEAARRDPSLEQQHVGFLIEALRLEEAEAALRDVRWHGSDNEWVWRQRARIAYLRDDAAAEEAALERALALEPSRRSTRERLRELTGHEPAREFLEAQRIDVAAALEAHDDEDRDDSLVALLDHSVVWVFEDGARERLTQNLHQVRDLAACERMKSVDVTGEVLAIASIDGKTHERSEPVLVDGKYVLPSLEPGDFVEVTYRTLEPAPEDGVLRTGGWYFASLEQTFERSRFVVSWPTVPSNGRPPIALRREGANLDGVSIETREEAGRTIAVMEALGRERVVPEPGIPPPPLFLPWVELGQDDVPQRVADVLHAEARWSSYPTPEIVEAAAEITRDVEGEEAQARALHRFVLDAVDQRSWMPAAPAHVLLSRRGNASYLYLALLRARGIDAELVWSRGVTPHADEDAVQRFFDVGRWRRQPLVLVRPADGEPAWCELHVSASAPYGKLPYGQIFGQASRSIAFATGTRREITTPAISLEEGPGIDFEATFQVDASGAARVAGKVIPRAGLGYYFKEIAQKTPENEVRAAVREIAARLVRGLTVERFRLVGLDEADAPIVLEGEGTVRRLFDSDGEDWITRLPIAPLELSAEFAGQGERRLPFRFPGPIATRATVRLELPSGATLVDPPPPLELDCPGGTYALEVRQEADGAWTIERRVLIDVFDLPASEFAGVRDFCRQVDAAERARLRVRR